MSTQRLTTSVGSTQMVWHAMGAITGDASRPLVLLHGGHGSWQHWARNTAPLAQHYRVLVPDLPGYGDSDTPPEPTMPSLVNTTRAALDQLLGADTPVRLAGFSFGGLVAAHIAAQRPNVTHLALMGPAGHGSPRRPKGALRDWRDAALAKDDAGLRHIMQHNLLMHMLEHTSSVDEQALDLHTAACIHTRFHSKKISLAGGLLEALATAQRTNPAMVLSAMWGEHDVTCTPLTVQQAMQVAGLRLQRSRMVPHAGHWVQYEASDEATAFLLQANQAGKRQF
jgi:pimeloyl-ACP methyl ester carboxylesterase